ncbi:MAG: hypothetical protein QM647_06640 [Asticcacaulis sp.]|uniref:hypothetical protein n=1 Tax=Asticcacaulis sp. TaxID=1872648 RepID=UPI0039E525B5
MVKPFEKGLYDLLGTRLSPECLEAFKARGDDAYVLGDLDGDAETDFYIDDMMTLLAIHGVKPPAEERVSPFWWLWPDKCLVYRDFTVGELKALAKSKVWPADAYAYEPVPLSQKLTSLTVMLVLAGLVLGIIALLGFWLGRWLK